MIQSLDDLERLFELMDRHRVDSVEINGMKIVKSQWSQPLLGIQSQQAQQIDDEDLTYWSGDE